MWVTKLLISQVKKGFFAQNWHFRSILARPCRLIQCPVGGAVGGCGARAVSRKTPIYFIIYDFSCLFCKCPRREKTNEHLFEIDTGSIKGQKILFWILRRDKIRLS